MSKTSAIVRRSAKPRILKQAFHCLLQPLHIPTSHPMARRQMIFGGMRPIISPHPAFRYAPRHSRRCSGQSSHRTALPNRAFVRLAPFNAHQTGRSSKFLWVTLVSSTRSQVCRKRSWLQTHSKRIDQIGQLPSLSALAVTG